MKCWLVLMVAMTCGACAVNRDMPIEESGFPSLELIEGNIYETNVTVIVEIIGAQHIDSIGHYSNWGITAKVRKSLKGNLVTGETIQYGRSVEGNSLALLIGSLHLVSFIWKEERLVIPDVGYHFPYSPTLRKHVEATFP